MEKFRYIILGAGPAGLAFAHRLLDRGERSFVVLEREAEPGGLCRSSLADNAAIDTGGGHFLDTRIPEVLDFLFRFMPLEEWQLFDRRSSIDFGTHRVDYPIESNIWQMEPGLQAAYLESVARCGEGLGEPEPERFEAWITWKLGDRIAADYMLPYNRKIWSVDLDTLGTYWINKLPAVSFEEIRQSCIQRKPFGTVPAHKTFYYPKAHGYGEVWRRMGEKLGAHLRTGHVVDSLDVAGRTVNGNLEADVIVNTVPWTAIRLEGVPGAIAESVAALKHTGIRVEYHDNNLKSDDQWIYLPDENLPHHRILNRRTFVPDSKGYWTETNLRRARFSTRLVWENPYAYPLNTVGKPGHIARILEFAASNNVFGLGRWGTWEHINSDIAVMKAMELADRLEKQETR